MKNKIRNHLFKLSILFIVCFLVLEIINLVTYNDKIYLEDKKDNVTRLREYKNRVNNLNDGRCKASLKDFVKRYEDTSYSKYVSLKDIYDELEVYSFPKSYQEIKKNCNILEDEVKKHGLTYSILDSMITYEEFYADKRYPYEIRIHDKLIRDIAEPSLDMYRYDKIKRSELEFLKNVLDLLEEKENSYYEE